MRLGSIWIGSTLAWVRPNCDGFTRTWYRLGTVDRFHKWTHLVPDRRTDLERICQVPYKCKAYISVTILYPFQTVLVSCKRSLSVVDFASQKTHNLCKTAEAYCASVEIALHSAVNLKIVSPKSYDCYAR